MNKIVTIGLGAAAVVLTLVVGAQFFGSPGGGFGFQPSDSPKPTATPAPTATADPTASPPASPPALNDTFTSAQHGYSVAYPSAWTAEAAINPWTDSAFPLSFGTPEVDFLYAPLIETELFLAVASQPLGDSTPQDWVTEQMASGEGCASTEPIDVGGAAGVIGAGDCNVVTVTAGGRGYWIQLYTGDEAPAEYDRAWFEEVLATMQLQPGNAVDAEASASP